MVNPVGTTKQQVKRKEMNGGNPLGWFGLDRLRDALRLEMRIRMFEPANQIPYPCLFSQCMSERPKF